MIRIDPGFQALVPPLTAEELAQLEANILADGCRDPLVTWQGAIIDGHNRYAICTRHGIEFETVEMDFPSREAAEDWMDANQLGRRNLTKDQYTLLLGRRYNRVKKSKADAQTASVAARICRDQNEPCKKDNTAQKLADEYGVSPATIKRAGKYAEAVKTIQEEAPELAKVIRQEKPTRDEVIRAAEVVREEPENAQEIIVKNYKAQGTGENEWYTPEWIINLARAAMGSIDLDPATCEDANETVNAGKIHTKEDDGLAHEWHGNVWMNPPYSRELMPLFVEKLLSEIDAGRVQNAIVLSHNNTDTKWFQSLGTKAAAICFPSKRIRFYRNEEIAAPVNGQVFVYLGSDPASFTREFSPLGLVVVPYA